MATDGRREGAVVAFRDVSQRRNLEQELRWTARHDTPTKLHNRGHFKLALQQELPRLRRSDLDSLGAKSAESKLLTLTGASRNPSESRRSGICDCFRQDLRWSGMICVAHVRGSRNSHAAHFVGAHVARALNPFEKARALPGPSAGSNSTCTAERAAALPT